MSCCEQIIGSSPNFFNQINFPGNPGTGPGLKKKRPVEDDAPSQPPAPAGQLAFPKNILLESRIMKHEDINALIMQQRIDAARAASAKGDSAASATTLVGTRPASGKGFNRHTGEQVDLEHLNSIPVLKTTDLGRKNDGVNLANAGDGKVGATSSCEARLHRGGGHVVPPHEDVVLHEQHIMFSPRRV